MSPEKKKIYRPAHELPGRFFLDYIILPYGEFYQKTKVFLNAKRGDTLRFYNGPDLLIEKVLIVPCDSLLDYLCKMRYGVSWNVAFQKWVGYARMEGHAKDILSKEKCLLVFYDAKDTV